MNHFKLAMLIHESTNSTCMFLCDLMRMYWLVFNIFFVVAAAAAIVAMIFDVAFKFVIGWPNDLSGSGLTG